MYTADSLILSPPRATPEQASAFFLARPHGGYTRHDIAVVIIPEYWMVCRRAQVNADLVMAQMRKEGLFDSWWSQRPRRNPAGIGVTGAWKILKPKSGHWQKRMGIWFEGIAFADWVKESIPAHVGRLLAYALPVGAGTPEQRELIDYALSWRPLPAAFRGTAPRLKALGRAHNPMGHKGCGWASPGTDYGQKIAEIANIIAATEVRP